MQTEALGGRLETWEGRGITGQGAATWSRRTSLATVELFPLQDTGQGSPFRGFCDSPGPAVVHTGNLGPLLGWAARTVPATLRRLGLYARLPPRLPQSATPATPAGAPTSDISHPG